MSSVETVKVEHPKGSMVINKDDFDPKVHKLFKAALTPEQKVEQAKLAKLAADKAAQEQAAQEAQEKADAEKAEQAKLAAEKAAQLAGKK